MAAVLALGFLTACTSIEPPSFVNVAETAQLSTVVPAFAGERPEMIDEAEIYKLSAEQERQFLEYFNDSKNGFMLDTERLYEYLKKVAGGFEYSLKTLTAQELHGDAAGNCLSLANLTTALARLAGIEVRYQLMYDIPIYEQQGSMILRGLHIRSLLYDPLPNVDPLIGMIVKGPIERAGVIIDYFPTERGLFVRNVDESEFSAMFYRNMAVEAMTKYDYATAYWYNQKSLEYAPDNIDAINMLAVLHRRAGDDETAEEVYQYGISLEPDQTELLKNYRMLLNDQGRGSEAMEIGTIISRLGDESPFSHWFLAEEAYAQANYVDALVYYKKAVRVAPYFHEGYFGIAKSQYQLGNNTAAGRALRRAVKKATEPRDRVIYEAKLTALKGAR